MASKPRKDEYTELERELDIQEFKDSIVDYFSSISDPSAAKKITYRLEHIFFIMLAAMLAGANSISQIATFGQAKAKWIKELIGLEIMPKYCVFWWLLVRLKPEFLKELLGGWLQTLSGELKDQILAIDGKCLRGTQSSIPSTSTLHLVSLFAIDTGILLAQQSVEDKSN